MLPPSPNESLPAELELPTGVDEVISVSSKEAFDEDVGHVTPSLKEQVEPLPDYGDCPRRTR